jgi:hypothetical protein
MHMQPLSPAYLSDIAGLKTNLVAGVGVLVVTGMVVSLG